MDYMKLTWIPAPPDITMPADVKKIRHEGMVDYLKVSGVDLKADIRWEIFASLPTTGSIECLAWSFSQNFRRPEAMASFTFFAPQDILPKIPRLDVTRRAVKVATTFGQKLELERGHAVMVETGAGTLHASWDFPEYEHPEV